MSLESAIIKMVKNRNQQSIAALAKKILKGYQLRINHSVVRISEIEFYLNNTSEELDVFTHKHHDFETGDFRLHGSGIDIAINEEPFYGGILIRGIEVENERIDGPWKVVERIVKSLSLQSSNSIRLNLESGDFSNDMISSFPRVGLKLKYDKEELIGKNQSRLDSSLAYIYKDWRFIRHKQPEEGKKSCLGTEKGKHLIALKLIKERKSVEEIEQLVNLHASTINGYGKSMRNDDIGFLKMKKSKLSIAEQCRLYGHLNKKSLDEQN